VASNADREYLKLLGDLTAEVHRAGAGSSDFSAYLGRPVAFAREVLNATVLQWQAESLQAFITFDLLTIATCNGAGKTGGFAPMAMLYCMFVEGGTTIYQTSTSRQARSQIIRELRRWLERANNLEATIYQHGVLLPSGAALIVATPGQMESAAGYHDEKLSIFIDESSALDDEIFESLMGNVIADGNRLVLLGNPLRMEGCFAKTHRTESADWWKRQVTAAEVIADPSAHLIRGIITAGGVNKLRQTFGEDSAAFQSRVWARFPSTPADALYSEAMLMAAVERHRRGYLLQRNGHVGYDVGVDVAANEGEGDESVIAVTRKGHVLQLLAFREVDTMKQVRMIADLAQRYSIAARMPVLLAAPDWPLDGCPDKYLGAQATFYVDAIGVGKGLGDRLSELGYFTVLFNASKKCRHERDALMFANEKARVHYKFREMLIAGEIGIPDDPMLLAELRVVSGFTNQSGKLQIVAKDDVRLLLGRSPDRADAVIQGICGEDSVDFSRVAAGGPVAF
jgi:hypothetical protein